MPRTIEPIDCSDAWEAIENPPIATISPEQWLAIEAAAAQAGEAGRATGNLYTWGLAAHDRLIALAEMPGAGILSLLTHLLMLRRDDLLESILTADYDGEIVHELAIRSAKIKADREKKAGKHCATAAADKRRDQRWKDAQGKPQETLGKIAEIMEADPKTCRATLEKIATLLGIRYQPKDGASYAAAPNRNELREMIDDRIAILEGLASPAPAPLPVVITAGPPAPGPQVVIEVPMSAEPEPAGPPPLTAEVLIAEAWEAATGPTTLQAIEAHQARCRWWVGDWREGFRQASDWWGPSAAAAIAHATGESFEVVAAHGQAVLAEHERQLALCRTVYSDAAILTADAACAGGWAWLASCQRTTVPVLLQRARELTTDPRSSAL